VVGIFLFLQDLTEYVVKSYIQFNRCLQYFSKSALEKSKKARFENLEGLTLKQFACCFLLLP
jgi:hypothetical protein